MIYSLCLLKETSIGNDTGVYPPVHFYYRAVECEKNRRTGKERKREKFNKLKHAVGKERRGLFAHSLLYLGCTFKLFSNIAGIESRDPACIQN